MRPQGRSLRSRLRRGTGCRADGPCGRARGARRGDRESGRAAERSGVAYDGETGVVHAVEIRESGHGVIGVRERSASGANGLRQGKPPTCQRVLSGPLAAYRAPLWGLGMWSCERRSGGQLPLLSAIVSRPTARRAEPPGPTYAVPSGRLVAALTRAYRVPSLVIHLAR